METKELSRKVEEARKEIQDALDVVSKKYGWKIDLGNITYNETSMRTKIEVLFNESAHQDSIDKRWTAAFPNYKIGVVIEVNGTKATIMNWDSNGAVNVLIGDKKFHLPNRKLRRLHYSGQIKVLST